QIMLEMKVKEKTIELSTRNRDMRLILDNAEEGFLTCSLDGHIRSEYSSIVEKWFTKPTSSIKIWDLLMAGDPKRLGSFQVGWDQFVDDFLPFEVCAGQMPAVIQNGNSYFGLTFTPIYDQDKKLVSILVVVTNLTAKVEHERRNRQQQELVATFQALSKDRAGFLEYFSDAENMLKNLVNPKEKTSKENQFRLLHTLKGNSAQYGLTTLAEVCHDLESKLQEGSEPLTESDIKFISDFWNEMSARLINMIGNRTRKSIELDISEYTHVLQRIKLGASHSEIGDYIERWRLEPAIKRLDRMIDQAKSLADRLNIENIRFTTNDNGIRLEPDAFADLWSSMIHVVRNSIDHGFSGGKIANPTLAFSVAMNGELLVLSIKDNGVGINWDNVREKAKKMNLPCATQSDLEECLFADGLSTKDEVSSISGRGVGMAAVKEAVFDYGGTIKVISQKGQGTEFIFTLPMRLQLKNTESKMVA
ncbi:MAG: ATP-binding protein, partial [Proteobacteria bacterium]|nr:ATP-binding protein [Pseudomonadota bacterium]